MNNESWDEFFRLLGLIVAEDTRAEIDRMLELFVEAKQHDAFSDLETFSNWLKGGNVQR